MNLPYIQSELFRELVGMETLLKPECTMTIHRGACRNIEVILEDEMIYNQHWYIVTRVIKTPSDITAEINRIWQEIPAECKKENTLI